MSDENRDISGRLIPSRTQQSGGLQRVVAVPPVRDIPNEGATELIWSGYSSLPAAGAAFVQLTDPSTTAAFSKTINNKTVARLSSMLVYCPDMVAAAAPYLYVRLEIIGQNANAWSFLPIYPRSGVASLSFPMATDIPAGGNVKIYGENTDAANTHLLCVYLYGWYWPKSMEQR